MQNKSDTMFALLIFEMYYCCNAHFQSIRLIAMYALTEPSPQFPNVFFSPFNAEVKLFASLDIANPISNTFF